MHIQFKRRLKALLRRSSDPIRILASHPLLMDEAWYLLSNPDVAGSGQSALRHFHEYGWREGRNPSTLFDVNWYLVTYADVKSSGINPLIHYIQSGWREGRSPSAGFDGRSYLASHPEILEGRITPVELHARATVDPDILHDFKPATAAERREIEASGLFQAGWYQARYSDVAGLADPFDHFVEHGMKEGRQPNPYFDSIFYLKRNPGSASTGTLPLVHYLRHGWQALRDPSDVFSIARFAELTGWTTEMGEPLSFFLARGLPGISTKPIDPLNPDRRINIGSIAPNKALLMARCYATRWTSVHPVRHPRLAAFQRIAWFFIGSYLIFFRAVAVI